MRPVLSEKSEKAHSPKKKGMHIFTIHCFHHVEQEDEFHPFIVNTVKHFTECSKMLAFLLSKSLVSPDTMTKGGGQHVFSFFICAFVSEL